MMLTNICRLPVLGKSWILPLQTAFTKRSYAKKESAGVSTVPKKKKMGKLGPMMEKKVLPVETDTEKLRNFVCGSNIYKTGEDIQIRPDTDYPSWLWTLRTGPPPPLESLDPESKEYWRRIRTLGMKRNNKLAKLRKF